MRCPLLLALTRRPRSILNVFRHWITHLFYDFQGEQGKLLGQKVLEFFDQHVITSMEKMGAPIKIALQKKVRFARLCVSVSVFCECVCVLVRVPAPSISRAAHASQLANNGEEKEGVFIFSPGTKFPTPIIPVNITTLGFMDINFEEVRYLRLSACTLLCCVMVYASWCRVSYAGVLCFGCRVSCVVCRVPASDA